jgi:hypothetical protein
MFRLMLTIGRFGVIFITLISGRDVTPGAVSVKKASVPRLCTY